MAKGVLTEKDLAGLSAASTPAENNQRPARLLLEKGVISHTGYEQFSADATPARTAATSTPVVAFV